MSGTTPILWTNIKINSHGLILWAQASKSKLFALDYYFKHGVCFKVRCTRFWMTKAIRGCGSFREVFFAQTHTSAPETLGAHFVPREPRLALQHSRNAPEFIAWVGGKSCHFFDDASKKWSALNEEWISCWSHPTKRTSSSTKRTVHVQHAGYSPHCHTVSSVFCGSTQKQANVWDEVTTGPPQIGRQRQKKVVKLISLDRLNSKKNDESWWTWQSILRAFVHTGILRNEVGSTFKKKKKKMLRQILQNVMNRHVWSASLRICYRAKVFLNKVLSNKKICLKQPH